MWQSALCELGSAVSTPGGFLPRSLLDAQLQIGPWGPTLFTLSITGFPFGEVSAGIKTTGEAKRKLKPAEFLLGLIQATSPLAPT